MLITTSQRGTGSPAPLALLVGEHHVAEDRSPARARARAGCGPRRSGWPSSSSACVHAVDDRVVVDAEPARRGAVVGPLAEERPQRREQPAALVVCDRQRRRGWSARSAGRLRRRGRTARPARRRRSGSTLPCGRSVSSAIREASSASRWLARKPARPRPGRPTPARTGPLTVGDISTSAPTATQTHAVRLSTSTASGRPAPHASARPRARALEQRVGHLLAGWRLQHRREMPAAELVAEPSARAREVVRVGVQDAADERRPARPRPAGRGARASSSTRWWPGRRAGRPTRRGTSTPPPTTAAASSAATRASTCSVQISHQRAWRRDRRAAATAAGSDAARPPASSAGSRGSPRPSRARRRAPGRRAPSRRWPRTSSRRARRPPALEPGDLGQDPRRHVGRQRRQVVEHRGCDLAHVRVDRGWPGVGLWRCRRALLATADRRYTTHPKQQQERQT